MTVVFVAPYQSCLTPTFILCCQHWGILSVYTVLSTLGNPHLKKEGHNFVTQTMTCQNRLSLLHCKVAERAWERGWSMDEESKALVIAVLLQSTTFNPLTPIVPVCAQNFYNL